jgi:CRP-like cAMP-binding protein
MMQTPGPNSNSLEELYRSLPADVAEKLRERESRLTVPASTKLIHYRKRPDHLVMLCGGDVEISTPCGKQPIRLSMAEPGRVFGLRALVSDNLPEIEAICRTECELRVLPQQIFVSALKSHPQMYLPVARLLSADLKLAQTYLKARARRKLRGAEDSKLMRSDRP